MRSYEPDLQNIPQNLRNVERNVCHIVTALGLIRQMKLHFITIVGSGRQGGETFGISTFTYEGKTTTCEVIKCNTGFGQLMRAFPEMRFSPRRTVGRSGAW